MARAKTTHAPNESFLSRLRKRPAKQPAHHTANTGSKVTHSESTNPVTGTHTSTTTRTTKGPHKTKATPATHHRRKPGIGDKISGAMMKAKGEVTRKPGVKAAGTRRMHGTDGKGAHRV